MEDYIGARVDYEPKYKDVLTYFQNIGNLYTWEADPWYETCKSWAETCYIHAGISGDENYIPRKRCTGVSLKTLYE